ncbi:retrovirus-related pol polyprotein from transposon TNT 1-94 [Tanacetum coccineum]
MLVSHSPFKLIDKWTKDHPLANVIGNSSRPVSTRKQLKTDAMWCYFDAFLTSVEPKNFKESMIESSWIEAMQEEIHKFERLQVWELVPCPDKGETITCAQSCKKTLYGLKQAPRAWNDMLSSFLISQHFSKGAVDPTLFTRKAGNDLLLGTFTWSLDLKDTGMSLTVYSDADYAGCQDTRRSTSGSAQFLGDKLVSWSCKKQKSTAISR